MFSQFSGIKLTDRIPVPSALGIYLEETNNDHAPRYKAKDTIVIDRAPASLGDEVACETTDGHFVIGELVEAEGNRLTLAGSCRQPLGKHFNVDAARYWRIVGCVLG